MCVSRSKMRPNALFSDALLAPAALASTDPSIHLSQTIPMVLASSCTAD